MTDCPSEDTIRTYSESQNPFIDFPKVFRHLGSCGTCTERVIALKCRVEDLPPKPSTDDASKVIEVRTWLDDQVIPDPVVIQKVTFDPPLVLHYGQKLVLSLSLERNDGYPESHGKVGVPFTDI